MSVDQDGCEWVNVFVVLAHLSNPRQIAACVCVCAVVNIHKDTVLVDVELLKSRGVYRSNYQSLVGRR